MRINTTIVCADDRHILLFTHRHAATAQNALIVIADQVRSGGVQLISRTEAVETAGVLHAVIAAQLLQLAIGGTDTGQALFLVRRQHQFQRRAARLLHLFGVGLNLHALGHGVHTRRHQTARLGGFHHADAASADLVDIFHEAQRGNLHTGVTGCLQNGGTLGYADSDTVYFNIDHFHFSALLSYFFSIASKRHFSIHAPHLMHLSVSILNGLRISPEMAPTGHTREHAEQPLHFSGLIS